MMFFIRSLWVGRLRERKGDAFKGVQEVQFKMESCWSHCCVLFIFFTSNVNRRLCDNAKCITFNAQKLWAIFSVSKMNIYAYNVIQSQVTQVEFFLLCSDSSFTCI